MAATRFKALLVLGLVALWAVPSAAFQPAEDSAVFEIPLTEPEVIQLPADLPMAVEARSLMTSRYGGDWFVHLWNPASQTPMAMYGTPVALSSSPLTLDAQAEGVATNFIANNGDILRARAEDLVVQKVARGNGKVAVHFSQRFHGLPVVGGEVSTAFGENGQLFVLGSTFYGDIDVSPVPLISAAQAEGIARNALPFNPTTDEVLSEPELMVLPIARETGGAVYHLVWQSTIGTAEPYGAWVSYVDAHDGEIVARMNDVHSLYSGTVQGDVDQTGYCDGMQTSPFRETYVSITGFSQQLTDENGFFSVAGSGGGRAISTRFAGPRATVFDQQFPNSIFNGTIQENVPLTIDWTDASPSRRAERDAFYWVTQTYNYIRSIDTGWSISHHTVNVNVNSTCNANWTTWRINLFREGGGCANTAHIGAVISHEYGHGIQFSLLGTQGSQGLGEGNGDIAASFMTDDHVMARGFNLNSCTTGIRDCLNNLRYPEHVVGQQIHFAGQVICGFNWDTRVLLEAAMGAEAGKAHTANLWHFARKLHSTSSNQPQQVLAYFLEDDDDLNLGNGTPNYLDLCEAAENHGFSCPTITEGVNIVHTPLTDTTSPGPYTVSADITAFGPNPLDTNSPTVFYKVNLGSFNSVPMINTGGSTWEADIPGQEQAAVAYYITAETTVGVVGSDPVRAPNEDHRFAVGTTTVFFDDDIETDLGWSVSEPGIDGTWERADPNGTFIPFLLFPVNPEDDHTPNPGVFCWVTGNPPPGSAYTVEDVDGLTSVVSPILDMTNVNLVRGTAWLWAYFGTNAEDYLELSASNDGGSSWMSVLRIDAQAPPNGLNFWSEFEFEIWPFDLPFTSQMQFKWTAEDAGVETVVDCAMDDFQIQALIGSSEAVSRPAATRPVSYVLHPSQPNPFNPSTQIRYELPQGDRVRLSIYDVTGRELRVLVDEVKEAGTHTASWDGTDRNGQPLASGVYFYRLEAGDFTRTHRMTLLK